MLFTSTPPPPPLTESSPEDPPLLITPLMLPASQIKSNILSLKTDMVTKICYFASSGDILAIKTMLQSDPEHDINT